MPMSDDKKIICIDVDGVVLKVKVVSGSSYSTNQLQWDSFLHLEMPKKS